jgi:hypothetical protein
MPESEAFAANQEIQRVFGSGGAASPLIAVVRLPEGTTVAGARVQADLRALERRLAARLPGARTASYAPPETRHSRPRTGERPSSPRTRPRRPSASGAS